MTAIVSSTSSPVIAWPLLPDEYVLPDDPVENEAQPRLAAALTNALNTEGAHIEDALMVSNFALCASIDGWLTCKAPDWMYVAPVKPVVGIRRSYTPHTEGAVPLVVMEFLSETDCGEYSTRKLRPVGKWYYYEQIIKVPTYVVFDPASAELEVYKLRAEGYERTSPDEQGRYVIEGFEDLRLGVWEGIWVNELDRGFWLRWWTAEGEMLLWSVEAARKAQSKAQEAEGKAQEAEGKAQKAEGKAQEAESKAQEAEGKAQEAEGKAQEAESKAQEAESKAQEAEGKAQEAENRAEKAEAEKAALLAKLKAAGLE